MSFPKPPYWEIRRVVNPDKCGNEKFINNWLLIWNEKWREPESDWPQVYKDHTSIWLHATSGVHSYFKFVWNFLESLFLKVHWLSINGHNPK